MHAEIITIGNEIISGRILDLNARYVAGRLTVSGLRVTRITTVDDNLKTVSKALKEAVKESRIVIVTGGLGSTEDDMTGEIAAKALNRPLRLDREMFEHIKNYAKTGGGEVSSSLEKMAWMPEGSKMLDPEGTTCGFSLIKDRARLYFLPGVPDQMRYLMEKFVLPEILLQDKTYPVLRHRILKLYGLNESSIDEILKDLSRKTENIILRFYPCFPENHITISLRGHDEPSVTSELDRVEKEIRDLLGTYIFATGNQSMEGVLGEMLRERNLTLSVAESCTGGLIGNLLTNAAGSSSYFKGGVIVYSNQCKVDLLNVSPEAIKEYGAVSDQTVREMAEGVKNRVNTNMGLAVTGIAGPDGGSEKKPVGTVHIGLALENETFSGKYLFPGFRKQVKLNTTMMALDWVRRYLNGDSFLPGV
ncbi:MAG: competence/damage-inducible protein A [Deltaproteobacteria bacterium]|nr:competence/damage-inducible protein A [Deltaproteobacteria bacterium]